MLRRKTDLLCLFEETTFKGLRMKPMNGLPLKSFLLYNLENFNG